ncbi:MAG: hypothetical protein CL661_12135 [Bacteroidetes bacterium]|nr:hypothetical protein [Bacteroidota bacterium]MAE09486.1 hypothetical protein [Bacteroidota bacterium]
MVQKKTIAVIVIICAMLINSLAYSQVNKNNCDTVKIVAPAYLVLDDTSIKVYHDSTAIICNRYIVITKKNGYSLYSKLVGESQKSNLIDKFFQMLIASSTQDTMLVKNDLIKAEDAYNQYSGKIIRNIRIQVLKPIGPTISDTNLPVFTRMGNAINKSHFSTNKNVLERKLLFHVNDTVNPLEMVENTRKLAVLPYLQDATIILTNAKGDSVDVLVLAKDKFPWMPGLDIYDINRMTMHLKNVNIFGLGQSLGAGITIDTKSKPAFYLSDINYYIDNMYKQIDGGINFHVSENEKAYQLLLNRELIPLSIRLAGGLNIAQIEENIVIDPTDVDRSAWFFKYRYFELWSSYLFYDDLKDRKLFTENTYFIPAIALYKRDYLYRPFVSVDSNSMFNNYTNLLGNFAFVKQNYYRSNYVRDFGKAEYIPYGFQATITGGYSWAEFMNKPYLGFGLIATKHFENFGYVFAGFDIGSHFSSTLEQGAINISLSYLTSVLKKGRYRYRLLTNINYTDGFNRFTNDLIYLGEKYGFIGMNDKAWFGAQRMFVEMVGISYTPWYFLGFRFAMYGFCSAGLLGSDSHTVFRNQLLSSVGVGVYVKNDFLAFNSFQVRVAYFPITPNGISHFGISFSTLDIIDQLNFLKTKPHIVEYR